MFKHITTRAKRVINLLLYTIWSRVSQLPATLGVGEKRRKVKKLRVGRSWQQKFYIRDEAKVVRVNQLTILI